MFSCTRKRKCVFIVIIITCLGISLIAFPIYSSLEVSNIDSQCSKDSSDLHSFSCARETSKDQNVESSGFPSYIHQIFFNETDRIIPERLEKSRTTWINRQPHFQYTLWNASMVEHLIKTEYCELFGLYRSYEHWVRRADMARYIVLYEYGGIYVDLDIQSDLLSMTDLFYTLKGTTGVALYVTQPAGVANDFIIAKPKHPFMKSVLCGLQSSNHWYVLPYITTMMSTGPLYIESQYRAYTQKSDIEILNSTLLSEFIFHTQGASWHQWDGKMIWWIYQNKTMIAVLCLISIAIVFFTRKKLIKKLHTV